MSAVEVQAGDGVIVVDDGDGRVSIGVRVPGGVVWRCDSAICPLVARHSVQWPGRAKSRKCHRCTAWLRKIADTMGFVLPTEDLIVPPVERDSAALRFALLELDG